MTGANVKYWAVVPAAGTGSRFGSSLPKQYAMLHGKTVLEHSVQAVLANNNVSATVIVLGNDDLHFPTIPLAKQRNIMTAQGGNSRAMSVFNGLSALVDIADTNDFVLVHDAARPLLHQQDLSSLQQALGTDDVGGILAAPISDTVKRVTESSDQTAKPNKVLSKFDGAAPAVIAETIDRTGLWAAQTPQMFRFGMLRRALQQALASSVPVTDEASVLEFVGQSVKVVASQCANFKITRQEDLHLAEFCLARRQAEVSS